ncbi:type IV secretion system protein [Vibrio aerogenes]|uniref:type IV secretion system protein n=1 Tax=Vibrio aerogenes TaxID=92172 RepID=UPI0021C291B2|nr:type IV secretion system protein [Vibrio aerogenes]
MVYLAYKSLYEPENIVVMEVMKLIGALCLCTFIAFNTSWYMAHVVPFLTQSGDEISSRVWGSGTSGAATIQVLFNNEIKAIKALWGRADFGITSDNGAGVLAVLMILLVVIGWTPFLAIATAYLALAKIMVSFLLILGPLFIMFALFPSTRSMFQAWTGQCLNYLLLTIVYPMGFNILDQALHKVIFDSGEIEIKSMLMASIIFGFGILVSLQIPTFCSNLSGGIGINGLVSNMAQSVGVGGRLARGTLGGVKSGYAHSRSFGKGLADSRKNKVKAG